VLIWVLGLRPNRRHFFNLKTEESMQAWKLPSRDLSFEKSRIMGILNITPDSFSDGGRFLDADAAFSQGQKLIADGADVLDLGAESTRPGADLVSEEIQIARLLPVLERLKKLFIPVSIDTTHPDVAEACLKAGAEIINDVSGLRDSGGRLAEIAARYRAGLVLMHRRGNAETMQKLAVYEDLIKEVTEELAQSRNFALEQGVVKEAIVVDPGLGFSKNFEQNLFILKHLERFERLGCPLLLGASRKSFIGHVTGRDVHEREFGSAACVAQGYAKGVRFFRVHDVKATRDVLKMLEAIDGADFKANARLGCL